MSNALMLCRGCGNEWEYKGLSCNSAYCPNCSKKNKIPRNAIEVYSEYGFGDAREVEPTF